MNETYNRSPNLLNLFPKEDSFADKYHEKVVFFVKCAIILVEFALILTIALVAKTQAKIDKLQSSIKKNEVAVRSYFETEEEVTEINKKVDAYKKLKKERTLIGSYINLLIFDLSDKVSLKSLRLENKMASITAEAQSPLDFSLLTSKYLKSGAKQITITSANLNIIDKSYTIGFDVEFK